ISQFTGWPKTTVTDALKELGITREPKIPLKARYGWKILDGSLVPHTRQQLVIEKMRRFREVKGWSWNKIAEFLNERHIPTLNGKKWDHKTVKLSVNYRGIFRRPLCNQ